MEQVVESKSKQLKSNQSTTTASEPARGREVTDKRPSKGPQTKQGLDIGASPLALDGWLEFNRRKWNVRPVKIQLPGSDAQPPLLEAVLYLDRRGQIYHPPRNPYLPIRFQSTPTALPHRVTRQWLDLSELLTAEMRRLGLTNAVMLPPDISDVRSWQWAGFRAAVRYTYFTDLPFDLQHTDKALGTVQRKAERAGYRCARTTKMAEVALCLAETEDRQGFSVGLTGDDLELARELLGDEHFRAFVCYAPNGEPASTSITLHQPGAPAIGWVGGTRAAHLRVGTAQLLEFFVIDDLQAAGASGYDLCGANLPTVAAAKATWGARLLPYYNIESYSVRRLAKWMLNWWRYLDLRRSR